VEGKSLSGFASDTNRRRFVLGAAATPLAGAVRRAGASERGIDVAVIGAGVFGCWTAWHMARAGRHVALIDAYGPANARASSGGESRVIRAGYGNAEIYSRWVVEALPLWQALSDRQAQPLLHRTGVLWFSQRRDRFIKDTTATLKKLRVRLETLDQDTLARRYPQIDFTDIGIGLLEPAAGGLMARRAVHALAREVRAMGGRIIRDAAGPPRRHASGVEIPLVGGKALRAGSAVYACGPWLGSLFPEIVGSRILPTRQEVFYFGPPKGDFRFAPPAMPVWADFNGGDIVYGLPDLEMRGFKMAFDAHGEPIEPDRLVRRISDDGLARARAYLARRFPALADAPLVEARLCQYENTSDGDFLIDRHPEFENVWLVGGGSGHGFKHGPSIGRYIVDLIKKKLTEPAVIFRLARKRQQGPSAKK